MIIMTDQMFVEYPNLAKPAEAKPRQQQWICTQCPSEQPHGPNKLVNMIQGFTISTTKPPVEAVHRVAEGHVLLLGNKKED